MGKEAPEEQKEIREDFRIVNNRWEPVGELGSEFSFNISSITEE